MNKLIIIGNGFDLAHKLKTSYSDFIDWYLEMIGKEIVECEYDEYESELFECKLNWETIPQLPKTIKEYFSTKTDTTGYNIFREIKERRNFKYTIYSNIFDNICTAKDSKWVDIELEYYKLLLTETKYNNGSVDKLNNDLKFIQDKLVEYLKIVEGTKAQPIEKIRNKIYSPILKREICLGWNGNLFSSLIEGQTLSNEITPKNTMLLNFNYTSTAEKYFDLDWINFTINYIHGKLDEPKNIIFGYGDELDDNYSKLEKYHSNKCLDNIKSIRYSETPNYRRMLEFIASDVFQVCIMGHSCGNSDRTLLNTIFEHKNCVSIKPYYYIKEDGTDNYSELVQNISRNFKDKRLMRNRVVNKEYCETII